MQATRTDKIYFYASVGLLYVLMALLVWCISPTAFMKPVVRAYSTPAVHAKQPTATHVVSGKPMRVVVGSVGIDLPVKEGMYDAATGEWTIGNYYAFYATPTVPTNDTNGTTLIYGHNNRTAFRSLRNLTPGAQLHVYTDNRQVFSYVYEGAREVQPTDTGFLTYKGQPAVILQTCSGNWDEFRKLFHFRFESVKEVASDA